MSGSVVIPDQLRFAREALGLSLEDAARHIGVDRHELKDWEDGTAEPPVEQLWSMAELYERGLDFFVKQTPRPPAEVRFRLAQKTGWHDLSLPARQVIAQFEELCRAAKELDDLLGTRATGYLPSYPSGADPEAAARAERVRLKYDSQPIRNVRNMAEEQGIRVFQLPVPHDEVSGFSWWHEEYGPCLLLNASDSVGRRNFTLAHEYAHLLAHESPSVCDLSDIAEERFANKFASAFLMPEPDVREQAERREVVWRRLTAGDVTRFCGRYGVSAEALVYRLHDLELVSSDNLQSLISDLRAARQFPRRPRAPSWRRRLGDTYVNKALTAFYGDMISVGKLARYLGVDVRGALGVLEREKPVPPDES